MRRNRLIVEGVDRTGKTTVIKHVLKKTDYAFVTGGESGRGPLGHEAYNRIFNKGQDSRSFFASALDEDDHTLTIFIDTEPELVEKRINDSEDSGMRDGSRIWENIRTYRDVIREAQSRGMSNLYVIENNGSVEDLLAKIDEILELDEKRYSYQRGV
jgi:thymidylate kinase